MQRRVFLKSTVLAIGSFSVGKVAGQIASSNIHKGTSIVVLNPYKKVAWRTIQQHKAALHLHTLQSDGYHMPEEVILAYRKAGYTVLSITDHDWNEPNRRIVGNWGPLPIEKASPYPKAPKPDNYPANPTWPWTDYGTPAPDDLGMVGIQGSELTYKHHINSYYNNYGIWHGNPGDKIGRQAPYKITDSDGHEISEDDQLAAVKNKGGLAILNHPSISDKHSWWERKPLQWYIERYRNHSPRYLVGIEVTNGSAKYNEALWDQLLTRFMPARPIWGFGNDDMHSMKNIKQTCNVFLLSELTDSSVREAMEAGQFFMYVSTKMVNYMEDPLGLSTFPEIKEINVDEDSGTITIHATGYDQIKWISAPQSLEPVKDYKISESPWPLGQVVHVGKTLDIRSNPKLRNYVRAEIILKEGGHINRILTNPFGIIKNADIPSKDVK
ncbi:MAG: hypothetical protein PF904_18975 [Kiritimatiellae bacterium]|jgi:hypothetical protein|nr:hypothetical protein [Kiritimatiellia bacterium]